MKIDLDTASDEQMAQAAAVCLHWLGNAGRDGARLLQPHVYVDTIEEAALWIGDLADGKDP